MGLPDKFSEWEHLQDQVRRYHNKEVNKFFKNTNSDNFSTPKEHLKHACLMKDDDTAEMTLLRKLLFEFDAGHAQSLQAPIYGIPVDVYQSDIKFKPQVHLHFLEKYPYIAERTRAVRGRISFVLMNESSENYSPSKADALALDVKREFGNPIFVWEKGKYYYYYRDKDKGYDLRLLVKSKSEGERVAKAVLAIQGHSFNGDLSDYVENSRTYPTNPGNQTIYGKSVPKPIKRQTTDVRFTHAQLLLHGRLKVINLVAAQGTHLKQVLQRLSVA